MSKSEKINNISSQKQGKSDKKTRKNQKAWVYTQLESHSYIKFLRTQLF